MGIELLFTLGFCVSTPKPPSFLGRNDPFGVAEIEQISIWSRLHVKRACRENLGLSAPPAADRFGQTARTTRKSARATVGSVFQEFFEVLMG